MNLRDLNYFIILAKTRHFGEAARQCFVSQPTLSMQIKKLEDELNLSLFERDNKHVMLTAAGKTLLPQAQLILREVEQLKQLAQGLKDPFAGELHLGVIPSLAPYLLPHIMPALQARFPKLRIWLIEEQTARLVDRLAQGEIDAALMATPLLADFHYKTVFAEPFFFACSKNNSFSKKRVAVADLASQPVMLLEEGHCLREQAMEICHAAKAATQVDFSATSLETLLLMVQAGMGVTLVPALAIDEARHTNLKTIPFFEPSPKRTIALYWRKSSAKTACLEVMADLISEVIKPLIAQSE